jgi:hypothetical protein
MSRTKALYRAIFWNTNSSGLPLLRFKKDKIRFWVEMAYSKPDAPKLNKRIKGKWGSNKLTT